MKKISLLLIFSVAIFFAQAQNFNKIIKNLTGDTTKKKK